MFNCPHDQEIVHLCNEYASKQCEDSFPLDWVFTRPLLGSFPDTKTATKILFLHSRRSWNCWPLLLNVPTGSFVPPPLDSAELSKSWGVRKWHLRTYWFIITQRRVKLTTRDVSGIAKAKMALPFSSCLFFLIPTPSPFLKLLKHLVEGCVCYSETSPATTPQIRVHSLWINVIFFKLIGLISFWLF